MHQRYLLCLLQLLFVQLGFATKICTQLQGNVEPMEGTSTKLVQETTKQHVE
jgi:hypothetical protein